LNIDLLELIRSKTADELAERENGLHTAYSRDDNELRVGFCQGLSWVLAAIDDLETDEDERRNKF